MKKSLSAAIIAIVAVIVLYPVGLVLYQSFLDAPFFKPVVRWSLAAYEYVLADEDFYTALGNSFGISLGMTLIAVPLSGRNSIKASMACFARPMARSSRVVDKLNNVSRIAPSSDAPAPAAATAATIIRRSMSITFLSHSVRSARQPTGSPPAK